MTIEVLPERCPKCKNDYPEFVESFKHSDTEYRERFECPCGKVWDNIYRYKKTKMVRIPTCD